MKTRLSVLCAGLLVLAITSAAIAQVTAPNSAKPTRLGGTASSGTGVPTGQGPLSQPVPPAASSLNFQQQNLTGNTQRAQGVNGPVQTPPQQQPFGR